MSQFEYFLVSIEVGTLIIFCFFGLHRLQITWLYWRHRKSEPLKPCQIDDPTRLPRVLIQLPIYNEQLVVERLIDKVCLIDYPKELLLIQVLDDSTDTCQVTVREKVATMKKLGHPIELIQREKRVGFKAGALDVGLQACPDYDFIAIFDADFIPAPQFLRNLMPYFNDEKVGMVQARWGHLNRKSSLLTQTQAVLLDGHFVIEHTARNRSGRFFNFNGTAGIWRRRCIDEAGGWHHETLTEDLDLSYRAQLRGWRFIYLKDIIVNAELPPEVNAFKSQQHRWAKGSIQVARKLLAQIWQSNHTFQIKYEATCHLLGNLAYVAMMIFVITHPLLTSLSSTATSHPLWWLDMMCLLMATGSIFSFLTLGQLEERATWQLSQLRYVPAALGVGIGLAVNNTRAVLEAIFNYQSPFVRTPKWGETSPHSAYTHLLTSHHPSVYLELILACYYTYAIYACVERGRWLALPFTLLIWWGFCYVSTLSLFNRIKTAEQT